MSPAVWAVTLAGLATLLALDLTCSRGRTGLRQAVAWSVFYVAAALGFGLVLSLASSWELGTQFLAGYLLEKSPAPRWARSSSSSPSPSPPACAGHGANRS